MFAILVFLVVKGTDTFIDIDSGGFISLAKELLNQGSFSSFYHTPGYPLFLLIGQLFTDSLVIPIFFQIIVSSLCVFLVFVITKKLFNNDNTALVAACLAAIEPLSILYASKLLTETLFTLFVLLIVYCFIHYVTHQSYKYLILTALAIAGSAYVRPISFYFSYYWGIAFLLLYLFKSIPLKKAVGHWFILMIITQGLIGIWQIRNHVLYDYNGFASVSEYNQYFYNAASLMARLNNQSYYQVQKDLINTERQKFLTEHPDVQYPNHEGTFYKGLSRKTIQLIIQNPITYGIIHLKGIIRLLFDPGGIFYLRMLKLYPVKGGLLGKLIDSNIVKVAFDLMINQPLVFWSNIILGIILIGFYSAMVFSYCSREFWKNSQAMCLILLSLYYIILSGGPLGYHRFRTPLMPIFCIIAAYGIEMVYQKFQNRSYKD